VSAGSTTATVAAATVAVLVDNLEFLAGGNSMLPATGASPSGFSAKGLVWPLVVVTVVVAVVVVLGWHLPLTHGPYPTAEQSASVAHVGHPLPSADLLAEADVEASGAGGGGVASSVGAGGGGGGVASSVPSVLLLLLLLFLELFLEEEEEDESPLLLVLLFSLRSSCGFEDGFQVGFMIPVEGDLVGPLSPL